MFSSKNYIEKPIHLVSINSFGKLVLHHEAISYLKTLKSPLSILSIAGPYRTGKSFLLNSIITNTQTLTHPNGVMTSFEVGHTTNETTHGLWIWSKPLLAYDENNQITNVLVMDSEGYASSQSTHDKRLITLAILLSTCFLFNSKGAIDKDSIFDLEFVIQVARMIGQKEEIRTSQENMKGRCDFHWILRDFQLELVNELGHKITPNEYMQNCLLQAQSRVNQKTIQTLKQYFPERTCHTLCHPSTDKQAQQRPQFISQIIGLKQSILKKNMKSFNMTGQAFVELLQSYIDAMNEGEQINSVFQEGYDCRVRLDCLEKLNSKLKRLEEESDDEIDTKLLNIKSEIKQYYKQRMCSHKQITVLNNQVQERITQYQQEFNSSKGLQSTSAKCVDRDQTYKNIPIIIPKSINSHHGAHSGNGNRNFRLSIQCSENEDRSFLGDDELNQDSTKNYNPQHSVNSHNNVRASRLVVQRKSIEKQKVSPEVKLLTSKIQQLQVTLHRTELQLSTVESQLTHQRQDNQLLRNSLNQKEDELMEVVQKCTTQQKSHLAQMQRGEEEKKQLQKQVKLLQSEIHKQSLLYEQKIQFLSNQLKFGDQARINEFVVQKNKYKQKIRQLTQQIQEMTKKHKQETVQVRGIFNQQIQRVRAKSQWKLKGEESQQGADMFKQLQQKVKQNQSLHKQVEQLKIHNQKLLQQLQATKFKSQQKEQSLKQQLQQVVKRSSVNEEQLKTLYETKLMTKDSQMYQLQTRIKSLNQIALNQNQRLIDSLKQMQSNFSEQKEDLFVMNNELRNGCLEALQRVCGLKEQIQMKQKRCEQLERDKSTLVKKLSQLKQQQQKQIKKQKQQQKLNKQRMNQQVQQKQQSIHQLECKLLQQSHLLQQHRQKSTQLQLQLQMQKQTHQRLLQQMQQLNDKLRDVEYNYKDVTEDLIIKQRQLNELKQEHTYMTELHLKQLSQLNSQLQQVKHQKANLCESISHINKQLNTKYQNLQLMFNDKHQYDTKKHQQQLKEIKDNQKKLLAIVQQKQLQAIKQGEKLKYLEKQLDSSNHQNKQTKQHLVKTKQQLQHKTYQYQQLQRQSSKHQALSTQKLTFLQHKLQLLTQQMQKKSTQSDSRQNQRNQLIHSLNTSLQTNQKLIYSLKSQLQAKQQLIKSLQLQLQNKQQLINSLNSQLQTQQKLQKSLKLQLQDKQHLHQQTKAKLQQLQAKQQHYQQTKTKLQQTLKLYQETQNNLTIMTKQAQQSQSQLMQQVQHLLTRQSTTQKDNHIMAENLLQLQQHMRQQQIHCQNHIRLYANKLNQVKHLKSNLETQLTQLKDQYQKLIKEYDQLQLNYNTDFVLWTKKFNKMQSCLKQAGWTQYQSTKNHPMEEYFNKDPLNHNLLS